MKNIYVKTKLLMQIFYLNTSYQILLKVFMTKNKKKKGNLLNLFLNKE